MILDKLPESIFDSQVLFISGIDTNVGKTYATAYLLKAMQEQRECRVISQKMIQTGCKDISEDIEMHRQLQGIELLPEDLDGTTSPIVLSYPASPHLAAKIDDVAIDVQRINNATDTLKQSFDTILLEGAGGLMVPIFENDSPLGGYLTIDYIDEMNYPVVLVTSGRLGSLNHTLLSIDACKRRNIEIAMIVYNQYPSSDEIIEKSSMEYLQTLGIPIVRLSCR
ncbi:MAG: dethiobiotin synthase [Rikenellaceae bacterium]